MVLGARRRATKRSATNLSLWSGFAGCVDVVGGIRAAGGEGGGEVDNSIGNNRAVIARTMDMGSRRSSSSSSSSSSTSSKLSDGNNNNSNKVNPVGILKEKSLATKQFAQFLRER